MNKSIIQPTVAELEILQVLWQTGPATVRVINEKLKEGKEVGYTTTLKLMQIMVEKGLLSRDEQTRTHIYAPLVDETAVQSNLLNRFIDAAYRGSATKLIMQALGNRKASQKELDAIREFLDKIEKEQGHDGKL